MINDFYLLMVNCFDNYVINSCYLYRIIKKNNNKLLLID